MYCIVRGLLKCVWRFILISMVLWLKPSDIRAVGIKFPIATSRNGPRRKEGNVLFNDVLNTFYLRLNGVIQIIQIAREEIRYRRHYMDYAFRLAARCLLWASRYRQDNIYHGLCYTSRGALAGTRNSWMRPPIRFDPTTHRTISERSYCGDAARSEWTTNERYIR